MNGSTQYGRYIQAENGKENTFAAGNALERRQNSFQYVPRLSSGTQSKFDVQTNLSNCEMESTTEGSDSELEFITSHTSGQLAAPFQPQRCSTPLSRTSDFQSYTDYSRPATQMDGGAYERYCASTISDYGSQVGGGRRSSQPFISKDLCRRLPTAQYSPTPSFGKSSSKAYNMVPEYLNTSSLTGLNSSTNSSGGGQCHVGGCTGEGGAAHQCGGNSTAAHQCGSGSSSSSMSCCNGSTGSPVVSEFVRIQKRTSASLAAAAVAQSTPILAEDNRWTNGGTVERQAQAYRLAASICVPSVVWSGLLPARNSKGLAYSCKVFLGGVPWDITEANLNEAFRKFGQLKVEWPSTHIDFAGRNSKGYLYIIFDNERSVRALLAACTLDQSVGNTRNYYYKVCSNRMRRKDVQVIPWQLADSTFVRNGCISAFGTKTVFVGSLHGMLNAEGLARIMDDLFGGVVAANIDTDKHKYPIGSGRVVFNCTHSYIKAIRAAFVELRTQKFSKKIQIDPFLEDQVCNTCQAQVGPFFCRDMECFQYYCGTCWQWQHSSEETKQHTPMMRNPRTNYDAEF